MTTPVKEYIRIYQAERRKWADGVTDFQLQKELYLAMVAMSDRLAAQMKRRKKGQGERGVQSASTTSPESNRLALNSPGYPRGFARTRVDPIR